MVTTTLKDRSKRSLSETTKKASTVTSTKTLLSVQEAAQFLGVVPATIYNWAKTGVLPPLSHLSPLAFDRLNVLSLMLDIQNGTISRLKSRANKKEKTHCFDKQNLLDTQKVAAVEDLCRDLFSLGLSRQEIFVHLGALIAQNQGKEFLFPRLEEVSEVFLSRKILCDYSNALPLCGDPVNLLGVASQFKKSEGSRAEGGIFYTPLRIAQESADTLVDKNSIILDPCCGAGAYLVATIRRLKNLNVENWIPHVWGVDRNPEAILFAKISCLLELSAPDSTPLNIFCADSLSLSSFHPVCKRAPFDLILTNPPWGAKLYPAHRERESLSEEKKLRSRESFSCFISLGLALLKEKGSLSYLLPESLFTAKIHQDIRRVLLENNLTLLVRYGRIFSYLMPKVFRVVLTKQPQKNPFLSVKNGQTGRSHQIPISLFRSDESLKFCVDVDRKSHQIFQKIDAKENHFLKNKAIWGMGVVTGNNDKYLSTLPQEGFEPIYRGKEIQRYRLTEPSTFISFNPQNFQQCAPETLFRHPQKLIYRFISKNLCFAYDDSQSLSLNSANILIPQGPFDIFYILAALNASYSNFYFQKRFNSIKVLRSHLERIPIPLLPPDDRRRVSFLAKEILAGSEQELNQRQIDKLFCDHYEISLEEIQAS